MLAALIVLTPVLILLGFTIWAICRCRSQMGADASAINREQDSYEEAIWRATETPGEVFPKKQVSGPCTICFDSYFYRGPMVLGGHGGGWGFTRHLTQGHRHRWLG